MKPLSPGGYAKQCLSDALNLLSACKPVRLFLQCKMLTIFWLSNLFVLHPTSMLILHCHNLLQLSFQEKKRLTICNIARQWEIQQNRTDLVASLNQDKDNQPCPINGSAAYVFPEESRYYIQEYFFPFLSYILILNSEIILLYFIIKCSISEFILKRCFTSLLNILAVDCKLCTLNK